MPAGVFTGEDEVVGVVRHEDLAGHIVDGGDEIGGCLLGFFRWNAVARLVIELSELDNEQDLEDEGEEAAGEWWLEFQNDGDLGEENRGANGEGSCGWENGVEVAAGMDTAEPGNGDGAKGEDGEEESGPPLALD